MLPTALIDHGPAVERANPRVAIPWQADPASGETGGQPSPPEAHARQIHATAEITLPLPLLQGAQPQRPSS
jgi:hypothetical protein